MLDIHCVYGSLKLCLCCWCESFVLVLAWKLCGFPGDLD